MKNNFKNRNLKQTPRLQNKFVIRYLVTGISILGCMALVFMYLNFTQSNIAKANVSAPVTKTTYRSDDLVIKERLIREAGSVQRTNNTSYKNNPSAERASVSRASDIIIRNNQ